MSNVVTGLAQNSDTAALRAALTGAGFSLDHLQVISADDAGSSIQRGIIGADLITGDRGADVPGISGVLGVGGGTSFFRNEGLEERLLELHIPDSEVENYVEALERGKTIVAYFTKPEAADQVAQLFKASAMNNVRLF